MVNLINGDCLEEMRKLPDGSVDLVLCDLPYGTTRNPWDSVIPLEELWGQYKRIVKRNGAVVLFAQSPFDKVLGCSNLEMLKHEIIWEKPGATGFLNANFAPLKAHENILVFSWAAASFVKDKSKAMVYNPQMSKGTPYKAKQGRIGSNYDEPNSQPTVTENHGERYPRSVVRFNSEKGLHPTQKPVPLLEYLIRTYTNEGGVVLDNCMGSGSTGAACVNTDRNFIGIELDESYFQIARKRIAEAQEAKETSQITFDEL